MVTTETEPRNGALALAPEMLQELEEILRRRKALLADDVLGLERGWTDKSEGDASHSNHVAESGTDAFEEDLRLSRMQSAGDELIEIEEALGRIRGGTFGVCEGCGNTLSLERLRAIPYARLCIPCKQTDERN